MNIQVFSYQGRIPVSFLDNGYVNATVIGKHFGKRPETFLKTEETKTYIQTLAQQLEAEQYDTKQDFNEHSQMRKRSVFEQNQLVIVKRGAPENGGGTWLHPKLAILFARWCDVKFAVWCDIQIEKILSGSLKDEPSPTTAELPKPNGEVVQRYKRLMRFLNEYADVCDAHARHAMRMDFILKAWQEQKIKYQNPWANDQLVSVEDMAAALKVEATAVIFLLDEYDMNHKTYVVVMPPSPSHPCGQMLLYGRAFMVLQLVNDWTRFLMRHPDF